MGAYFSLPHGRLLLPNKTPSCLSPVQCRCLQAKARAEQRREWWIHGKCSSRCHWVEEKKWFKQRALEIEELIHEVWEMMFWKKDFVLCHPFGYMWRYVKSSYAVCLVFSRKEFIRSLVWMAPEKIPNSPFCIEVPICKDSISQMDTLRNTYKALRVSETVCVEPMCFYSPFENDSLQCIIHCSAMPAMSQTQIYVRTNTKYVYCIYTLYIHIYTTFSFK